MSTYSEKLKLEGVTGLNEQLCRDAFGALRDEEQQVIVDAGIAFAFDAARKMPSIQDSRVLLPLSMLGEVLKDPLTIPALFFGYGMAAAFLPPAPESLDASVVESTEIAFAKKHNIPRTPGEMLYGNLASMSQVENYGTMLKGLFQDTPTERMAEALRTNYLAHISTQGNLGIERPGGAQLLDFYFGEIATRGASPQSDALVIIPPDSALAKECRRAFVMLPSYLQKNILSANVVFTLVAPNAPLEIQRNSVRFPAESTSSLRSLAAALGGYGLASTLSDDFLATENTKRTNAGQSITQYLMGNTRVQDTKNLVKKCFEPFAPVATNLKMPELLLPSKLAASLPSDVTAAMNREVKTIVATAGHTTTPPSVNYAAVLQLENATGDNEKKLRAAFATLPTSVQHTITRAGIRFAFNGTADYPNLNENRVIFPPSWLDEDPVNLASAFLSCGMAMSILPPPPHVLNGIMKESFGFGYALEHNLTLAPGQTVTSLLNVAELANYNAQLEQYLGVPTDYKMWVILNRYLFSRGNAKAETYPSSEQKRLFDYCISEAERIATDNSLQNHLRTISNDSALTIKCKEAFAMLPVYIQRSIIDAHVVFDITPANRTVTFGPGKVAFPAADMPSLRYLASAIGGSGIVSADYQIAKRIPPDGKVMKALRKVLSPVLVGHFKAQGYPDAEQKAGMYDDVSYLSLATQMYLGGGLLVTPGQGIKILEEIAQEFLDDAMAHYIRVTGVQVFPPSTSGHNTSNALFTISDQCSPAQKKAFEGLNTMLNTIGVSAAEFDTLFRKELLHSCRNVGDSVIDCLGEEGKIVPEGQKKYEQYATHVDIYSTRRSQDGLLTLRQPPTQPVAVSDVEAMQLTAFDQITRAMVHKSGGLSGFLVSPTSEWTELERKLITDIIQQSPSSPAFLQRFANGRSMASISHTPVTFNLTANNEKIAFQSERIHFYVFRALTRAAQKTCHDKNVPEGEWNDHIKNGILPFAAALAPTAAAMSKETPSAVAGASASTMSPEEIRRNEEALLTPRPYGRTPALDSIGMRVHRKERPVLALQDAWEQAISLTQLNAQFPPHNALGTALFAGKDNRVIKTLEHICIGDPSSPPQNEAARIALRKQIVDMFSLSIEELAQPHALTDVNRHTQWINGTRDIHTTVAVDALSRAPLLLIAALGTPERIEEARAAQLMLFPRKKSEHPDAAGYQYFLQSALGATLKEAFKEEGKTPPAALAQIMEESPLPASTTPEEPSAPIATQQSAVPQTAPSAPTASAAPTLNSADAPTNTSPDKAQTKPPQIQVTAPADIVRVVAPAVTSNAPTGTIIVSSASNSNAPTQAEEHSEAFVAARTRAIGDAEMHVLQASDAGFTQFQCAVDLKRPDFPITLIFTNDKGATQEYSIKDLKSIFGLHNKPLTLEDAVGLKIAVQSMILNQEGIEPFREAGGRSGTIGVQLDHILPYHAKDANQRQTKVRAGTGTLSWEIKAADRKGKNLVTVSVPLGLPDEPRYTLQPKEKDWINSKGEKPEPLSETAERVKVIMDFIERHGAQNQWITKRDVVEALDQYVRIHNKEWVSAESCPLPGYEEANTLHVVTNDEGKAIQRVTLSPVRLRMDPGGDNPSWHLDFSLYANDNPADPNYGKAIRGRSMNLHTSNKELATARALQSMSGIIDGTMYTPGFMKIVEEHVSDHPHDRWVSVGHADEGEVMIGTKPLQDFMDDMPRYEFDIGVELTQEPPKGGFVTFTLKALRAVNADRSGMVKADPRIICIKDRVTKNRQHIQVTCIVPENMAGKIPEFARDVGNDMSWHAAEAYSPIALSDVLGQENKRKPVQEYRCATIKNLLEAAVKARHTQFFGTPHTGTGAHANRAINRPSRGPTPGAHP